MEKEVFDRIEALEQEVRALRQEVTTLKMQQAIGVKGAFQSQPVTKIKQSPVTEAIAERLGQETAIVQPHIPRRSLEQIVMFALPKVFMVILVLGVLWGLKLVSDYGYLSDSVKIVAGFVLSVGLAILAFLMEKKSIGSPAITMVLYAGTFIIGILTTAAGAILYDVLGLTIALVIAIVYIAYGVAISYVKGNEALTSLVIFTSLLLPYLLEYMAFNALIIVLFILVLFTVVQVVILKHQQYIALYIGTFFSLLAATILASYADHQLYFGLSIVIALAIFLFSYLRLSVGIEKKRNVHEGLLFSLSVFTIFVANITVHEQIETFFVLGTLFAVVAAATWLAWQHKYRTIIDILLTILLLVALSFVMNFDITYVTERLMLLITAFVGLVVGIRLRASFMKITYSIVFGILALIIISDTEVQPFFELNNFTYVLLVAMLVGLYVLMKRPKELQTSLEKWMEKIRAVEWMPVLIYGTIIVYTMKLSSTYLSNYAQPYITWFAVVGIFTAALLLSVQTIGRFLPIVTALVYSLSFLIIMTSTWVSAGEEWLGLGVRLLYVAVFIALVVDVWMKGRIYKNYVQYLKGFEESISIVGMIVTIIGVFGITSFMNNNELASWNFNVILNTITIFVTAGLSLLLAAKRDYNNLRLTGVLLLIFGFVKLIFFDLAALDLLIRSILFIGIGGIGLVLSNKLLAKK